MSLSFFQSRIKKATTRSPRLTKVKVDMHAHVLPGLDDGPALVEQSVQLVKGLAELGIQHVVATPHVMSGYYPNTLSGIMAKRQELENALHEQQIAVSLAVAAEYYIEPALLELVESGQPLLTLGTSGRQPYLLLESALAEESLLLKVLVERFRARSITPIIAHPERNTYLQQRFERAIELFRMGCLFQLDIRAFLPSTPSPVRRLAERLVDFRMASFVGTNVHTFEDLALVEEAAATPYFQLMVEMGLLNKELL